MTRKTESRSSILLRPILMCFAVTLLIGSLLGARAISGGNATDTKAEAPKADAGKAGGPIVMGTVDSNPQPIHYGGLPAVLSSGTIAKVAVKEGDQVKAGDLLYEFDTTSLKGALEVAQSAVAVQRIKVDEAREKLRLHGTQVQNAESLLADAVRNEKLLSDFMALVERGLKVYYKNNNVDESMWASKLADEPTYFDARVKEQKAKSELNAKQAEVNILREGAKAAGIMVLQAEAGVKQAEAEVDRAQNAINQCRITAKIGGTIEQVTISPGTTLGISSVKPALWLIPEGPRVVRAEVEAEFAYRVSPELIGKEVTIFDNTNPKLTYTGKVKHISGTFLTKRSANEGLLGSETRILEVMIAVTDATPAGKPPLRVGQRVRVDLGQ